MKPIVVVGSLNIDLVVTAARFAGPGETILGHTFETVPGGKGANQAVAAARLGHPTRLFGMVGSDPFAARLRHDVHAAGVDIAGVEAIEGSSGVALITAIDTGANSIIVVPGANAHVSPSDIDRWWPRIEDAGVVLAQLEISMPTVEHLAGRCKAANIPLILDPAPAHPLPPRLLQSVTWLTPNETEVLALTGIDITAAGEDQLRAVAETFLHAGVFGVLLKLGARGAYLAFESTRQLIPPFPVTVVDTTAAGDAFNGAFAVSLLQKNDPVAAAGFAAAAAALSTTVRGATPSLPTLAAVQALLARP